MPAPHRPAVRLDIRAADPHCYDVSIRHQSGAQTEHQVSVNRDLLDGLGLSAAQEPVLVRTALTLLLEHSPASLPDRFDLADVRTALPDFDMRVLERV